MNVCYGVNAEVAEFESLFCLKANHAAQTLCIRHVQIGLEIQGKRFHEKCYLHQFSEAKDRKRKVPTVGFEVRSEEFQN